MRTPLAVFALTLACTAAWAGPADSTKNDNSTVFALPTFFYTTDTGAGCGAVGVYGYQSGADRASQAVFSASNTTKKQSQAAVQIEHYSPSGQYRFFGKVFYNRYPSDFFGIGNDTSNDAPGKYTPEYLIAEASVSRKFGRGFWLRGGGFFRNQALVNRGNGDATRDPAVPWGTGRLDAGALAGLLWDTRDNTMAATRGTFAFMQYSHSLYQDHGDGFGSLSLDIRAFRSPRPGWVLASQVRAEGVTGDCPFYFFPDLGGQDRLRGYETGRFIGRNAVVFQQDVRFPVWWRIGGCAFVSAGRVANNRSELLSGAFNVAYGAGIRYAIDPEKGMVARADYAVGKDAAGMYITFGEAF